MRRLLAVCAALLALSACNPAFAQGNNLGAGAGADAAYTRSIAMTVGTPLNSAYFGQPPFQVPIRGVLINCTAAGTVTFELQDTSTLTMALPAGVYVLPLQVIEITASTGTAQFWALG